MAVRVAKVRFKSKNLEVCCISRNKRNAYSRVGGLPISLEALRRTPRGSGEPSGGCGERNSLLLTNAAGAVASIFFEAGDDNFSSWETFNDRWPSA